HGPLHPSPPRAASDLGAPPVLRVSESGAWPTRTHPRSTGDREGFRSPGPAWPGHLSLGRTFCRRQVTWPGWTWTAKPLTVTGTTDRKSTRLNSSHVAI